MGHLKDLPHHLSCLQRTKHPETALSAEVSMRQGPSVAGSVQGRRRGSTGPGAPEAAPRPGFSPAPEAGRCSGGRRVPETHQAKAKTPVVSPSEVHVLCPGQSASISRSICSTASTVLHEDMIVVHMVIAALWGQSL